MPDSGFRPGSDAEWAALLRQLRQQPNAQPRPFFYARVRARLAATQAPATTWPPAWVRRPAFAVLLMTLVLAVSGDGPSLRPTAPASFSGSSPLGQPAAPAQR